jgi:hypothetical protein
MEIEWQTIQFFLTEDGKKTSTSDSFLAEEMYACEVSVDAKNPKKARCTCNTFQKDARCKHVKWVKERMEEHEGIYTVRVRGEEVSDEETMDALESTDDFRTFVMRHGTVEIL